MKRLILIRKRMERGLSQTKMAARAGISVSVIARVEQGKIVRPSSILKLAEAYGMSAQEFVLALFPDNEKEE